MLILGTEVEGSTNESEFNGNMGDHDYACVLEAVYEDIPDDAISKFVDNIPKVLPVKINELGSHVFKWHRKANEGFKQQFGVSIYVEFT